jgi:hypothetical protein
VNGGSPCFAIRPSRVRKNVCNAEAEARMPVTDELAHVCFDTKFTFTIVNKLFSDASGVTVAVQRHGMMTSVTVSFFFAIE